MKPGLISKIVKNYLQKGKWDLTVISKKDRFFAATNILTFKLILIHRIKNSIDKILKLNLVTNRLSILDSLVTSDALEAYYMKVVSSGKSLELTKEITDR